jgi:nucleoside-diphosphate-sugar epimerase
MKKILVTGAGGFIAGYLVKHLLSRGYEVVAADIKPIDQWYQVFNKAENYSGCNLQEKQNCYKVAKGVDRIYNLACNMGGMGFVENNQALCMENVLIQTHILMAARDYGIKEVLYSSTACVYPAALQSSIKDQQSQSLKESDVFPANPDDGYGWEKLFSELLTHYYAKDFGIDTRVCRYHNVYGPHGTWRGGREKAPAAICRKIIEAKISGKHEIEIWGDGEQTRSFMFIDDCLTGMDLMWEKGDSRPLNLGSDRMVSINQLVDIVESIAGIKVKRNYNLNAPQGVRGRNSDNTMIKKVLGWAPSISLEEGIEKTYKWIYDQISQQDNKKGY